jgi:glutathione S-transferase
MPEFTIVLGNKAYSSWSLRGWLVLKLTGAAFDEVVVPLDRPETKAAIRAHSPSGRVPTLKADGLAVWDTLAIAEYLHERFPEAGLWPEHPAARTPARSRPRCTPAFRPCARACPWT